MFGSSKYFGAKKVAYKLGKLFKIGKAFAELSNNCSETNGNGTKTEAE